MRKQIVLLTALAGLVTASSIAAAISVGSFRVVKITTEPIVELAHAGPKACHYSKKRGMWLKDNRKQSPCPRRRCHRGLCWVM